MRSASEPILPGATLGVLGSGQLGRMFALAARRMGYRVHTLSPDDDTPTGQVADLEIRAAYDDLPAVRAFAAGVDVVTFEFENVPAETAAAAADRAPVRPGGHVLHTTQHRLREKTFLSSRGFAVTPFAAVASAAELTAAIARLGTPAILKTAGWGYDGKGQFRLATPADAPAAWAALRTDQAVLEAYVDYALECSVVAARDAGGRFAHWGVIENAHREGILDVSVWPARVPPAVAGQAVEVARAVMEALDVVGVLCVEFFLDRRGRLLINELAPRPHNSGHLTIDAHLTSQFEQQLRAACNLPLGECRPLAPAAAMANLLGDVWPGGRAPAWDRALAGGDVKLHLYGKHEPRAGRKMGHLTAVGDSPEAAMRRVLEARSALAG